MIDVIVSDQQNNCHEVVEAGTTGSYASLVRARTRANILRCTTEGEAHPAVAVIRRPRGGPGLATKELLSLSSLVHKTPDVPHPSPCRITAKLMTVAH